MKSYTPDPTPPVKGVGATRARKSLEFESAYSGAIGLIARGGTGLCSLAGAQQRTKQAI